MNANIKILVFHCYNYSPYSAGGKVVFTTDPNHWINKIGELSIRRIISWDSDTRVPIRMLRYGSDGTAICSVQLCDSRDGEYIYTLVFFPNELKYSGAQMLDVVQYVEEHVKPRSTVSECFNADDLTRLSQTHVAYGGSEPPFMLPATQSGFALRYVDGRFRNLCDVLDKGFQRDFAKYEWVILAPEGSLRFMGNPQALTNITESPLLGSQIITPPVDHQFGFEPYLNGTPFTQPMRLSDGEILNVVWRRAGYADILKQGKSPAQFEIRPGDLYRIITPQQIMLVTTDGQPVSLRGAEEISFDPGRWDPRLNAWLLPEEKLAYVQLRINKPGYLTVPINHINLTDAHIGDKIRVEVKAQSYEYRFRVITGPRIEDNIEFTKSYSRPLTQSPLPGYRLRNRMLCTADQGINELEQNAPMAARPATAPGFAPKQNVKGKGSSSGKGLNPTLLWILVVVAALALAAGAFLLFFTPSQADEQQPQSQEEQTVDQADNSKKIADALDGKQASEGEKNDDESSDGAKGWPEGIDPQVEKAIEYLNKGQYKQKEMNSVPGLDGLWTAMNNFQFQKVMEIFKKNPQVMEYSSAYGLLEEPLKTIIQTGTKIPGMYKPNGDDTIVLDDYIDYILNYKATKSDPKKEEPKKEASKKDDRFNKPTTLPNNSPSTPQTNPDRKSSQDDHN